MHEYWQQSAYARQLVNINFSEHVGVLRDIHEQLPLGSDRTHNTESTLNPR